MLSDIIALASTIISFFATLTAVIGLSQSKKYNKQSVELQKKENTIKAYKVLQEQVLDELALVKKQQIIDVVKYKNESDGFTDIYNTYRTLIARCEHFAVGINCGVYDFEVFKELSGVHMVILYNKFEPIISISRKAYDGKRLL